MTNEQPSAQWPYDAARFASGAVVLFNQFRGSADSEAFVVSTTLKSGRQFYSIGLQFNVNAEFPGSVLILDSPRDAAAGVIVRDDDIASIEFQPIPPTGPNEPTPFGFAAHVPRPEG